MWLTNNKLTKTDNWIKCILGAVILLGIIDTTTGWFLYKLKIHILFTHAFSAVSVI